MASSSVPEVEAMRRELEAARLEAARERARAGSYAEEIRALKQRSLEAQSAVEREEEFLTNSLMKKLEQVNSEKREMLMRVEQEEEFLTNALQKRLDRVMREKHELEVQMAMVTMQHSRGGDEKTSVGGIPAPSRSEDELRLRQEELESERARLVKEKVDLERALETEQEAIVNKLTKQTSGLRAEKDSLRHEREELRRQVESLLSDKIRLHREKVQLENTLEQEEENIVNRLQTQMLELYQRNQILQRRLEQSGSQTPSVVSESDASEDEGGWGHAHAGAHFRRRGRAPSTRGAVRHRPRTAPRARCPRVATQSPP